MIIRKSRDEIEAMSRAGAVVAKTLALIGGLAKPGVTTAELDEAAETYIRSARPRTRWSSTASPAPTS